jgi:hypothetical protein
VLWGTLSAAVFFVDCLHHATALVINALVCRYIAMSTGDDAVYSALEAVFERCLDDGEVYSKEKCTEMCSYILRYSPGLAAVWGCI